MEAWFNWLEWISEDILLFLSHKSLDIYHSPQVWISGSKIWKCVYINNLLYSVVFCDKLSLKTELNYVAWLDNTVTNQNRCNDTEGTIKWQVDKPVIPTAALQLPRVNKAVSTHTHIHIHSEDLMQWIPLTPTLTPNLTKPKSNSTLKLNPGPQTAHSNCSFTLCVFKRSNKRVWCVSVLIKPLQSWFLKNFKSSIV